MKSTAPRSEVVLATWPSKSAHDAYLGDRCYRPSYQGDVSASFTLRLREGNDAVMTRDDLVDIGLWVHLYASTDGMRFSIEPRLSDVHSADLYRAKRMVKALESLCKRMPEQVHGEGFESYLRRTLVALRIKRAVEYHGIGVAETYCKAQDVATRVVALYNELAPVCQRGLSAAA